MTPTRTRFARSSRLTRGGEGGEFPTEGDYLWFPHHGTVLLTDVPDASAVEAWVKWEGLMCRGPIGDGVAWGASPHDWIAVEGTIEADEEFKILRKHDWPRLPMTGDVVNLTVHPPYMLLHVAESDGPREHGTGIPGLTMWQISGLTTTYDGEEIGATVVDLPLHHRPWDT